MRKGLAGVGGGGLSGGSVLNSSGKLVVWLRWDAERDAKEAECRFVSLLTLTIFWY